MIDVGAVLCALMFVLAAATFYGMLALSCGWIG